MHGLSGLSGSSRHRSSTYGMYGSPTAGVLPMWWRRSSYAGGGGGRRLDAEYASICGDRKSVDCVRRRPRGRAPERAILSGTPASAHASSRRP